MKRSLVPVKAEYLIICDKGTTLNVNIEQVDVRSQLLI